MPRSPPTPDHAKLHFGSKTEFVQFRITKFESDRLDAAMRHLGMENRSDFLRHVLLRMADQVLGQPSAADLAAAQEHARTRQYARAPKPRKATPAPLPAHLSGFSAAPQVQLTPLPAVTSYPVYLQPVETPELQDDFSLPAAPLPAPTAQGLSLLAALGVPMYADEASKGPMELPLPDDTDDWT